MAARPAPLPLVKEEVATPYFAELPYAGGHGHGGSTFRRPKELIKRRPGVAPECKTCVGPMSFLNLPCWLLSIVRSARSLK